MRGSARVLVIVVGFVSLSLTAYARFAPLDAPESRGVVPGTVVLDVHGNVLERDASAGLRIPTTIDRVAPRMLQATISAEDRRFLQHVGIDPIAVARALANSSAPSGASTITQQLARRLYLTDDASPLALRKAHEALIALQLEAGLQSEAERLVRLRLEPLRDRNATDAALVAIEPRTGRIVAWVGSATDGDPIHGGEIDMVRTPRQPGSALKPLLYAAAFEHGYTAATPLLDVPSTFATDEGPYTPANFDRSFHGVVPLRVALASSLNVPAVRTLDAIGLDAMLEISHRFGLTTLNSVESYGLALTLGSGEVRLMDLTNAFAAFGAGGMLAEPFAIARVRDASGRILFDRTPAAPRRVLSAEHAYLVTDILSDPDARIPGFGGVTPIEARDWARAAGLTLRSDGASAARDALRIVAPVAGTKIYFAPELSSHLVVLRAVAARGIERVTFAVDGLVIGDAPGFDPWLEWPLELGTHTLRASAHLADGSLATVTSAFEVKR